MTNVIDDDGVVHSAIRHEGLVYSDADRPYVPWCDRANDLARLGSRSISAEEFTNGIKPQRQFAHVTRERLTCVQCLAAHDG